MKQMHDIFKHILANGEYISNGRTKEGYYSVFGYQTRFNLREGYPATTGKKLFFKGVKGELLWFLEGSTDNNVLRNKYGVTIWDEWATKEQTAKFGREEGDLGPVYGKLWRAWEAIDQNKPILQGPNSPDFSFQKGYETKTIDQIQRVVDRIKTNPSCRRLIVSGWNPAACDQVALPPCHTLFQFKVSHGGTRLNCQLYQRSADAFLGVPFNIASYALLTHMIAQVTGLEVGEFVHTFGDLHIYENHLEQVKEYLSREPLPLPKLWLNPEVKDINKFTMDDIKLIDYKSHGPIKADVAI
jgi:thymidylate synthase